MSIRPPARTEQLGSRWRDFHEILSIFRKPVAKSKKLRYATIVFAICVRLSVCPHETTWLPLEGFSRNFERFSKICREKSISLKSDKKNGYLT